MTKNPKGRNRNVQQCDVYHHLHTAIGRNYHSENNIVEKILLDFYVDAASVVSKFHTGEDALKDLVSLLLMVACVLDAPIDFFEYIISTAWKNFSHIAGGYDCHRWEQGIDAKMRQIIVNVPLQSYLLNTVLDFVLRSEFAGRLPPAFAKPHQNFSLEERHKYHIISAAFDGATALHFAAARGAPDKVKWLIANGADVTASTHAGEWPIHFVPCCQTDKIAHLTICKCPLLAKKHCPIWETRWCLLKSGLLSSHHCIFKWLIVILLGLFSLLQLRECHNSLFRPGVLAHANRLLAWRLAESQEDVLNKLREMRLASENARRLCDVSHINYSQIPSNFNLEDIKSSYESVNHLHLSSYSILNSIRNSSTLKSLQKNRENVAANMKDELLKSVAALSFASKSHAILHQLDLKMMKLRVEGLRMTDIPNSVAGLVFFANSHYYGGELPLEDLKLCQVLPSEQAEILQILTLTLLWDFGAQNCPKDSMSDVLIIMKSAIYESEQILQRVMDHKDRYPNCLKSIQICHLQSILSAIYLILLPKVREYATLEILDYAQIYYKKWEELVQKGVVEACGFADNVFVKYLKLWIFNKEANVSILKVMRDKSISEEEIISEAVDNYVGDSDVFESRKLNKEFLKTLRNVLDNPLMEYASVALVKFAKSAYFSWLKELSCHEKLTIIETLASNNKLLSEEDFRKHNVKLTLNDALVYPRLKNQMISVKDQLKKCQIYNQALAQLEIVVHAAKQPILTPIERIKDIIREVQMKHEELGSAVENAERKSVPTHLAKKVHADIKNQILVLEAAVKLKKVLELRMIGYKALRAKISQSESILSSASTKSLLLFNYGESILHPLLRDARSQLEVEKTSESIVKAINEYKCISDLPKLEGVILSARKVGNIDKEILRRANELRATLTRASKSKSLLEQSLKLLNSSYQTELVKNVETAIRVASEDFGLLSSEIMSARAAVQLWHNRFAVHKKLMEAINKGTPYLLLSSDLQEAVSAGIRIDDDLKVCLKAMQLFELAVDKKSDAHCLREKFSAVEATSASKAYLLYGEKKIIEHQLREVQHDLEENLKSKNETSFSKLELQNTVNVAEKLQDEIEIFLKKNQTYKKELDDLIDDLKIASLITDCKCILSQTRQDELLSDEAEQLEAFPHRVGVEASVKSVKQTCRTALEDNDANFLNLQCKTQKVYATTQPKTSASRSRRSAELAHIKNETDSSLSARAAMSFKSLPSVPVPNTCLGASSSFNKSLEKHDSAPFQDRPPSTQLAPIDHVFGQSSGVMLDKYLHWRSYTTYDSHKDPILQPPDHIVYGNSHKNHLVHGIKNFSRAPGTSYTGEPIKSQLTSNKNDYMKCKTQESLTQNVGNKLDGNLLSHNWKPMDSVNSAEFEIAYSYGQLKPGFRFTSTQYTESNPSQSDFFAISKPHCLYDSQESSTKKEKSSSLSHPLKWYDLNLISLCSITST